MIAAASPKLHRHTQDLPLSVKAVVQDGLGRVLVLKDARSAWQDLPGGHVRAEEALEAALRREIREETALEVADIERLAAYDVQLDNGPCTVILHRCVALTDDIRLSDEHVGYNWVEPQALRDCNLGVFLPLALKAATGLNLEQMLAAVDLEMMARAAGVVEAQTEQERYAAHVQAQNEAEEAVRRAMRKALHTGEASLLESKKEENGKGKLAALLLLLLGAGLATAYYRAYKRMAEESQLVHVPTKHEVDEYVAARKTQLTPFVRKVVDDLNLERARGDEQSESPDEIASRMDEAAEQIEKGEAERAVKTEAQVAYGSAQLRILQRAGFKTVAWVTMDDDKVRASHTMCEEQGPIPIGNTFHNGLRYPGDPNGPPEEVINCRCWLVGVERNK